MLTAIARVAATYRTFNSTSDEPAHIATGMEWLERGSYTYEVQHPPLARVAVALGPYVAGARLPAGPAPPEFDNGVFIFDAGNRILYAEGQYWRNLTLARIGVLPFLVLLCAVSYRWGKQFFSVETGLAATFLLTCTAPVLGQAGIATLDLAAAATSAAALYCFLRWLEDPAPRRAARLGVATAAAILTKFSAIGFLGACCTAALCVYALQGKAQPRRWAASGLIAVLAALLLMWAAYRFTIEPLGARYGEHPRIDRWLVRAPFLKGAWDTLLTVPLPLTEVMLGVRDLLRHNAIGHESYLFGEYRSTGWWYFFPVVLAVKTPLGLLVLGAAGALLLLRGGTPARFVTALFPFAILAVAMTARINVGVRHILPVFPLLSVLGGHAIAAAFSRGHLTAAAAAALAAWTAADSVRAHPDYVAHFNELAGSHPEQILVESDLDIGQDLHRLSLRLKELGASHVSIGYAGSAPLALAGLPRYRVMGRDEPEPGYVAVSLRYLYLEHAKYGGYAWLRQHQPIERVGKSINLYYLPEIPR